MTKLENYRRDAIEFLNAVVEGSVDSDIRSRVLAARGIIDASNGSARMTYERTHAVETAKRDIEDDRAAAHKARIEQAREAQHAGVAS